MGAGGYCPEVREEKLGELVLVGKRASMGGGERKRGRLMGLTAQLSLDLYTISHFFSVQYPVFY